MDCAQDINGMNIIVTCEHGGNKVPARFAELFCGRHRLLNSHRGYDRYALLCARSIAHRLRARFFYSTVTRLLVDLNRSPRHPKLFSHISGKLDINEKNRVIKKYYLPYRNSIESSVSAAVSKGATTLHVSVHSFAPVMNGQRKNADIGLLYDPSRDPEKALCLQWQKRFEETYPSLKVRRNYPYLGSADGLVTYLRKLFSPDMYIGIELELNQKIMNRNRKYRHMLFDTLVSCMRS